MKQQNLFPEECGHKNFVESAKIRNNLKAKSKTVQNVHWKLRQNEGEGTASNPSCGDD